MWALPKPLAVVAQAALASTACGPQPATEAPAPEFADLVLHGGKVVTVDSDLGTVQAIAVNGYRIAAVGDDAAIASFHASVSRMDDGEPFLPHPAMTRMEAIRSYTLDDSYSAFEERVKGSLTPGKYADIVVLSEDLLTIEESRIPDTQVDYTIIGGEVRYARRGG